MIMPVLCRELAQQVAGEARSLRGAWGLRVAAVFGGADKAQQVWSLHHFWHCKLKAATTAVKHL